MDSVFFKAGYGGTWFFGKYTYPSDTPPISLIDTFALGADVKFTNHHAVSASYAQTGIFVTNFFEAIDVNYKFFPVDWYNQIFVGSGLSYLNYGFADQNNAKRFGANLTYGFYFQFPGNIYLTAEFKNIFHADTKWSAESTIIQHTFSITGSVAYRLMLSSSNEQYLKK